MGTKALVVLSGGQDSTICTYVAKRDYDEVHAVTFDYCQKHRREIDAARAVAKIAGIASHEIIEIGPVLSGSSPLTNPTEKLETYSSYAEMDEIIGNRRELTFVPMRNPLFLTIAANRAEVLGCDAIVTGVCAMDNANYSDCRPAFVEAMQAMIAEALDHDIAIVTPLLHLTKAESVKLAMELPGCMEALAYSHTAYSGEYPPLTQDHATVLRSQGFLEAGVPDPLIVRAVTEGLMEYPDTPNYNSLKA